LEVDLVPFDHFAASSRSSFSCCFAIRASWAAAFYSERQRTGIAKSVVYFGIAGCLLCVFAKFLWHGGMILVGMMKLIDQKGRAIYVLTVLWASLRFHPFYPRPQYHPYHNIISQSMPSYPSFESSH